jgi:hypothetical protein
MANETYYSLLGVSETATTAQIKTAYLRLISEVHPDRIANAPAYWQRQAEEKCKEINEAYAILSSDEKRRLYDAELASRQGYRVTARETAAEPSDPPPASATQQNQATSSAPPKNDTRNNGNFFLIFTIAALVAVVVFAASQQGSGNTSASQPSKEPPVNSWRYTKSTDEMTGKVSEMACLFSEDKLYGNSSMRPGELCNYRGGPYPAVLKIGRPFDSGYVDYSFVPGVTRNLEYCNIGMRVRVDDKPGFEVCGHHDNDSDEVHLQDPPYVIGRGIHIMTLLKNAKIIKIELVVRGFGTDNFTQIFTFKPDKPLDRKW